MQKGYTLIELLAASAIFAGMMIIAVGIFAVSSSQEGIVSNRRVTNQSSRSSVDSIIREVADSKNDYDSDGSVASGGAGFVISDWDQNNIKYANQNANGLTSGNALVVSYIDDNNKRALKAYYLCPHATYAGRFTLGVKNLKDASGDNITDYKNGWNQQVRPYVRCSDPNWKPLISNDVAILSEDDLNITGYYPDSTISKQPYITVTLRAVNAKGTRTEEQVSSTYRATIVQRDYGYSN